MPARRFPPPWSLDDNGARFIGKDYTRPRTPMGLAGAGAVSIRPEQATDTSRARDRKGAHWRVVAAGCMDVAAGRRSRPGRRFGAGPARELEEIARESVVVSGPRTACRTVGAGSPTAGCHNPALTQAPGAQARGGRWRSRSPHRRSCQPLRG
jgi:hypothetical protein